MADKNFARTLAASKCSEVQYCAWKNVAGYFNEMIEAKCFVM